MIKKFTIIFLTLALSCSLAQSNPVFAESPYKESTKQGKATRTQGKTRPSEKGPTSKTEPTPQVAEAINKLKADFENELTLREANIKSLGEILRKRQELFNQGIASRKEVEEAEANLKAARAELEARRQKINGEIEHANDLVAEVIAAEQLAKMPLRGKTYVATNALIRYSGGARWVISDITKVSSFFVSTFNHALPVSAFGQTEVHNRLGFDHSNSVDVALHPDSPEGQALIAYLRNAGIPFLAFRQAVPGSATGAHIHIGYPSHRFIQR